MGLTITSQKRLSLSGSANHDSKNPFVQALTKKERICLRETYQKLADPKEIVGKIFVDVMNEEAPELRKVFGVDRAPRAIILKMPKLGGHIARITDFIEQLTTMLGCTENLLGAWQLVRKIGRFHIQQQFLAQNQSADKNYFSIVGNGFVEQFVTHLIGEKNEQPTDDDKKKVRFASNYTPAIITDVWMRFFQIIIAQLTDAFEQERGKQASLVIQMTLAPHQLAEENVRKQKRIREKQSEIENSQVLPENKKVEQLLDDPF